jgi:hypothetical protein
MNELGILADTEEYIDACVGVTQWQLRDGSYIIEKDYRVQGEVWRVHKNDADPYPSNPHAHCIDGAPRFVGCTLHLGTAELYNGRKPLERRLKEKQFKKLIELIQPKFSDIKLPLDAS